MSGPVRYDCEAGTWLTGTPAARLALKTALEEQELLRAPRGEIYAVLAGVDRHERLRELESEIRQLRSALPAGRTRVVAAVASSHGSTGAAVPA